MERLIVFNENVSGIYLITRKTEEKEDRFYVGSSINIKRRMNAHKGLLRRNKHKNTHLQHAWNLYGEEAFVFEVLEYASEDVLIERESHYIETLKTYEPFGYNICRIPDRQTGVKYSEEQNRENSKRLKEYYKDKPSPFKGKKHTEEAKKKISENSKLMVGEKNGFFGKKHSEETKKIISEKNKGREITDEHKEILSNAHQGEKSHLSKLTESDVLLIKDRLEKGERQSDIAKDFNITKQNVFAIKEGRTWSHVTNGKITSDAPLNKSGSKLTVAEVIEIINMLKDKKSCQSIADIYGVAQETINAIKLNRTWKHIPRD